MFCNTGMSNTISEGGSRNHNKTVPSLNRVHGYRVGINANGRLAVHRLSRLMIGTMNFRNRIRFSTDGPSKAPEGLVSMSGLRDLN